MVALHRIFFILVNLENKTEKLVLSDARKNHPS